MNDKLDVDRFIEDVQRARMEKDSQKSGRSGVEPCRL